MKKTLLTLSLTLLAGGGWAGEFTGNVSGYNGQKSLDDKDWGTYDSQGAIGIISDYKLSSWPVSIAVDGFFSLDDDGLVNDNGDELEVEASTFELHVGVRKTWQIGHSKFSPYVGGGIAHAGAHLERTIEGIKTDDDDTGVGAWLGAGIYWRPIKHLNLGLDIRYSQAEVTLFERDVEAGGTHAGFFIGYHW